MQEKTVGRILRAQMRLGETRCACRRRGLHSGAHGWNRQVWKKHEPLPKVNHINVYIDKFVSFPRKPFSAASFNVECSATARAGTGTWD